MVCHFPIGNKSAYYLSRWCIRIEGCFTKVTMTVLFVLRIGQSAYGEKAVEYSLHSIVYGKVKSIGIQHRIDFETNKIIFCFRHYTTVNSVYNVKMIIFRINRNTCNCRFRIQCLRWQCRTGCKAECTGNYREPNGLKKVIHNILLWLISTANPNSS